MLKSIINQIHEPTTYIFHDLVQGAIELEYMYCKECGKPLHHEDDEQKFFKGEYYCFDCYLDIEKENTP